MTLHENDRTEQAIRSAFRSSVDAPPELLSALLSLERGLHPLRREKNWGLLVFLSGFSGILLSACLLVVRFSGHATAFLPIAAISHFPVTATVHVAWSLMIASIWTMVGFLFTYAIPLLHPEP